MRESELYDLTGYGEMIADRARVDAYHEALREVIRPGCTVLDVGAGTGLMTLLALGLGASHVYAVEPASAIHLGRRIARDNQLTDRITFIQDTVFNVSLDDRLDVAVSDLRGVLPLFRRLVPATIDIRERLLKPGGSLIPARDHLFAAVVEAQELHDRIMGPWRRKPGGFGMQAGVEFVSNRWRRARFAAAQILTEPVKWATLDYKTIASANVAGEFAARITRPGTGHGLALWFDAELTDYVALSNEPGDAERIYGQAFFPWPQAVGLDLADVVEVSLRAHLVRDEYEWRWDTSFPERDGKPEGFRQSTFYGSMFSPIGLQHTQTDFAPTLSPEGDADRRILAMIDGRRTLHEIAAAIFESHPDAFADRRDAFDQVARLAWRYYN